MKKSEEKFVSNFHDFVLFWFIRVFLLLIVL